MVFSRTTLLAALQVTLFVVLFGGTAHAQGIQSATEPAREGEEIKGDTRVIEINEVERGLSLSVDYGANYYFFVDKPAYVKLNQNSLLPGTRMGMRLGYDILNNLSVDAFVLANFNKGVIDVASAAQGKLTGDLAHIVPGIGVRFAFVTTDRLFVYARAAVGYALWFPSQLAENAPGSIHTDLALGIEYYTRLRHLSIGLELDGQALIAPNAFGIQAYPTIKYTF